MRDKSYCLLVLFLLLINYCNKFPGSLLSEVTEVKIIRSRSEKVLRFTYESTINSEKYPVIESFQ